ncbi:MAG: acyltransferase [Anaerolineaceae bacterium]
MAYYSESELRGLGIKRFGERVRISCKASIYGPENFTVGNDVRIDDFCILSAGEGGIELGSFIHIAAYSSIIGRERVELGDFANISSRVSVYSSSDDYSGSWMTNPTIPEEFTGVLHAPVKIGRHTIVGAGCVILPGVTIEDGVAIGALSLIKNRCLEFGVYCGIPAKRVAERKRKILQIEQELLSRIAISETNRQ